MQPIHLLLTSRWRWFLRRVDYRSFSCWPIFCLLLSLLQFSTAQAQNAGGAFSCDGTFYQTRQSGTGASAFSVLYRVDRSAAVYTTNPVTGGTFGTTGTLSVSGTNLIVNALAYNSQDGYLYAVSYPADNGTPPATAPHIYKIGLAGVQDLGVTNLPVSASFAAGTFDKTGNYYLSARDANTGSIYRINVASNPLAATTVAIRNAGNTGNTTATIFDLAYNPSDNNLYGVQTDGMLYKLVLNGTTQALLTTLGAAGTKNIGSAFFDISGRLYAYSNGTVGTPGSGEFFIVNTGTGGYTQLSTIEPVYSSDGASCINPVQRIDVTKEAINVVAVNTTTFDITYTIRVRNTGTVTDDYVQVSDLLFSSVAAAKANTTFPTASSISITAAPVVTNLDGSSLAASTGFTGISGNASLLSGTQGLTAGQRASITYTVRVVFPTGGVPNSSTPQNNTAYGTVTASSPNLGYTQASDGSLVTPSGLEANDASTNSSSYADLRADLSSTGDTPSPTPITFAPSISGTVFEDVNYGGGLGRSQGSSLGVGRGGARVELYSGSGTTALYQATTTTAADGGYSFTGLTAGSSYVVRVLSNSVTSSRTGAVASLLPVQTYRTTVTAAAGTVADQNRVGGEDPARTEAGNGGTGSTIVGLTTPTVGTTIGTLPESLAPITLSTVGSPAVNVDFGYNFDAIVNTNDSGQGSLRQFIVNSNALGGEGALAQVYTAADGTTTAVNNGKESSIFMITNGTAVAGLRAGLTSQLTSGVAVITPLAATSAAGLPAITGPNTAIDGTTQTRAVGNLNNVALGTAGKVGTAATTLLPVNGPEVQLTGSTAVSFGLDVATTGTGALVQGLAIYGFGNTRDDDGAANIRSAANNVTITQNVVGTGATAFTQPSTPTNADNIRLTQGTTVVVSNNLIGFSNSKGIAIDGLNINNNGVIGATISGNEVRGNGLAGGIYDGIDAQGSSLAITGNLLTGNAGQGIDSFRSVGSNTISGNTITDNGRGPTNQAPVETPGVRIYGSGNTVSQNIISDNYGAGILLEGATANGTFGAAATTTLSRNSIFNNGNVASRNGTAATGAIGIDLNTNSDAETTGTSPFVTLNSATTTGANGLLNYPVLTSANVVGTNLVVKGYAKANASIELFLAQANPTSVNATGANFGQGKTYLTTVLEGGTLNGVTDANSDTGQPYSGLINGFDQGSDTNANGFTFAIPLASLPTGVLINGTLPAGTVLTSTATLGNATSEFSGNVAVPVGDVTVSLAGATTLYAGRPTSTYTATFTNESAQVAAGVARVITLPTGASLSSTQQTALTSAGATIGTDGSGNTTLTYPALTALAAYGTNAVTFSFTAPTALSNSLTLKATTTADAQGANLAPDQATLTLATVAAADATASISAATTTTTGTFTVTFGNNGPQNADGLTPTVQLPANLPGVSVPTGWTYTPSTGLVSYNTANSSLNATTPLSLTISYPLATAPSAPVTAVASISTVSDEAGLKANNVAQAVMPTAFDLTTTLSGPATAITDSPLTLYVTTTNNGPNTAPNATQTVTIPSSASLANNIFISNGGTYSYTGGVGTVTFPALASLPAGQTVTNSISFLAPAAKFAPYATVSSTAPETSTTNNTAYLNGNASSKDLTVTTVATVTNEATTIVAKVGSTTTDATVVSPGSTVTYTVTATNDGPTDATNVVEQVQLLPGLTGTTLTVGTSPTVASQADGTIKYTTTNGSSFYNPTTGVLTYYTVNSQNAGTAATITYDKLVVVVPAGIGNNGQLLAVASVTTALRDNVPADNVASVGVLVKTLPDVATTITGPASTAAGLPASYVVKFVNAGTATAATVTETAQLPAGLSGVTVLDASGATVSGAYNSSTGLVTFPSVATDAAGAAQTYTIQLAAAPAQTYPVSSAIASTTADGVATNNAATLSTTVTPNGDLAVSLNGPAVATVGNMVTYTIGTTNNGPTPVSNAVVTLQLPTGLTLISSGGNNTSGPNGAATKTTSNGIDTYTFPAFSSIVPGGSVVNYLNFAMPNAATGLVNGQAAVSSSTSDLVASNNTSGITTSISPATTATADLRTSISLSKINGTAAGTTTTVAPGASLTYDVAFRNAGDGSGTAGNPALNVMPSATLPAGLSVSTLKLGNSSGQAVGTQSGNIITFNNAYVSGATYNITTGLLTFPSIASAPVQTTTNADYFVNFPAPVGSGQLVLTSAVASTSTDNVPSSNFSAVSTSISTVYDVTTSLNGPSTAQPGAAVSYAVTTLNNGPSPASATTTQKVDGLPTGLTAATLQVDGLTGTGTGTITFKNSAGTTVATYSGSTLTLADVASLPAGAANEVVHSFSFPMPTTGSVALTATVASANESTTTAAAANNTAPFTTAPANVAPVAQNVWNTLQSARGNTANLAAANGLPISPLNATDADGSVAGYTIVTVPDATTQGKLYLNSGGTYTLVNAGKTLTAAQAGSLTFAPVAGYAGDVAFTYTATDNGNGTPENTLTSPAATYTLVVAQDQATTYAGTPAKGGTNQYAKYDVLAYVVDPNTAVYNSSGLVYGTTGGTTALGASPLLQSGAANGLPTSGTNATLATGTGPAASGLYPANPTNALPDGVTLDPVTGLVYVSGKLTNYSTTKYYQVNVVTTDINGGTNTTVARFFIGAYPLPVELTAFTARAVANRDALLTWTTASELNSAYFGIERSLNGVAFTQVGQLAAQGSKLTASSYSFTDAGVGLKTSGPVYYRLRQVDQDGTTAYSAAQVVQFATPAAAVLSLYPNPAQLATTLELSALPAAGTYQVLVLDAAGRQVLATTLAGGAAHQLDVAGLASGSYQVLVSGVQPDGSPLRQVLRLTKQ